MDVSKIHGPGDHATDAKVAEFARLIATAPDLLAAVRAFLAYDSGDSADGESMVIAYAKARKLAINAYAKAVAADPVTCAGVDMMPPDGADVDHDGGAE